MKWIGTFVLLFVLSSNVSANCTHYYTDLKVVVENMGWKITSAMGGRHNTHSKHYIGKAIDVSVRGRTEFHYQMLKMVMEQQGYIVLDERRRPPRQRVWGGPHIHIHIPFCK